MEEKDLSALYAEPVPVSRFTEKEYPLQNDADIFVSASGDDSSDGSFDHPFATFNRAVEAVRELKKAKKNGDIKVAFMAGEYGALSVRLTEADTGTASQRIIYCSYGNGDVIFNNGFSIAESEFMPLSEKEKKLFRPEATGKIRKADISDRLVSYRPATGMLLGDKGECFLSRYPDKNPDGTDQLKEGVGYNPDNEHIAITLPEMQERLAGYHTTDGIYLYGYLTTGWYKDMIETDGYDRESCQFHIPYPEKTRMGLLRRLPEFDSAYWNKTAVINVSEELDADREYWIDQDTKIIYVFSPEGDYSFTGGDNMISLDSASYITIRGLSFRCADSPMICAKNGIRGLTVDGCKFDICSDRYMVNIDGGIKGEPYDIDVRNCSFSSSAGTALNIEGIFDDDLFNSCTNVVVDNNYFTLTNLRLGNLGALKVRTSGPHVTHNHFKKCYWEGIDFREAVDLVAEYNIFDQICYNGDDTGAVNNYNTDSRCGNRICHNLFMNITGGTNGRFCAYLDDSAGTKIENNLYYRVDSVVVNNGISKYNTFCGNVVIKGPDTVHYKTDFTEFTEKAMAEGDTESIKTHEQYLKWVNAFAFYDAHPEMKERIKKTWKGYFDITTDLEKWQTAEFCMNASLVIKDNVFINGKNETGTYREDLVKYSDISGNTALRFDEDPYFKDPSSGDYRTKEGTGAPDIQFEKIGRY